MIYVIVFLVTILLLILSLKFRYKNKKVFIATSLLALLIPCVLAGMRDYTIGTDVNLYVAPLFKVSLYYKNIPGFLNGTGSEVSDIGYLLLTYMSGKLSDNIFILFFLSEVLVLFPIYKALLNVSKDRNVIVFGIFIFFMTLYNLSFNMVRQSIAISFALLSFTYFINDKKIKSMISLVIAFLFHKSSIVLIPALFMYKFFLNKSFNNKKSIGMKYIIICMLLVLVAMLPSIISILIKINILDAIHYGRLLSYNTFDINYIRTAWYLAFYLLFFFNRKKLYEKLQNADFYAFMAFISIIILQLGAVIQFTERIGYYYFYIALILGIPFLTKKVEVDNATNKKKIINFIVIALFISYWIYWTVLMGSNQTYPFIFRG